jgi:hypothetical protein
MKRALCLKNLSARKRIEYHEGEYMSLDSSRDFFYALAPLSRCPGFIIYRSRRGKHQHGFQNDLKTARKLFYFSLSTPKLVPARPAEERETRDDHRFGEKDVIMKINWSIMKNHRGQSATQREEKKTS